MHSPKLISVIIPVFNDLDGITKTLEGLARQTWPMEGIEVIVVDNGSEEPVAPQSDYPFPVHVVGCETPGSYAARNAGVVLANGEVFAFTDADCVPCRHWLERGVESLIDEDGRSAVGGEVTFVPLEAPSAVALYQMTMGFGQQSNIRDKGFSATANLFCTRAQLNKVGPFDERLLSGGDREWAWRASTFQIGMKYQSDAIVHTAPRSTLRGAIRQARRVVAGRAGLRQLGLTHIGAGAVAKQRSVWQSVNWILSHPELRVWNKVRVLSVAVLIRFAAALESVRLSLGAKAERR